MVSVVAVLNVQWSDDVDVEAIMQQLPSIIVVLERKMT